MAVSGLTLTGADAGNYVLSPTASATASITAATLSIASAGPVAGSKVYGGTTAAAVTTNGTLAGVIGGDAVTLALTGTAYGDKNVGTGKAVSGTYVCRSGVHVSCHRHDLRLRHADRRARAGGRRGGRDLRDLARHARGGELRHRLCRRHPHHHGRIRGCGDGRVSDQPVHGIGPRHAADAGDHPPSGRQHHARRPGDDRPDAARPRRHAGADPGGAAVTVTAAPSQNIAPAVGTEIAFPAISQYDRTQYTGTSLPDWASGAGEATIAAMVARGLAQTPDAPKIDSLSAGGTPGWATIDGVRLIDRNGTARTSADAAGFPLREGVDLPALLADGPVMLGGGAGPDGTRPVAWMLAAGLTADGAGVLANDPATGLQVCSPGIRAPARWAASPP